MQADNCCHATGLYFFAHTGSTAGHIFLPFHISLAPRYRSKAFACVGSLRIKNYNFFSYIFFRSLDVFHGEYMELFCTGFKWMYITHRRVFQCVLLKPPLSLLFLSLNLEMFSYSFRFCCPHCGEQGNYDVLFDFS